MRRAVHTFQKTSDNKKKDDHPDGGNSNSDSIPSVPRNKFKPNTVKVKPKNIFNHPGIHSYCVHCEKGGIPRMQLQVSLQ